MGVFSDPLSPWRLPLRWLYPANWCAAGFEEQLKFLQSRPELRDDRRKLSDRAGKRVWRIDLPAELGGASVVYKFCDGKAPWRYVLNLSHPAREWRNYQALYALGVPAPEVLAYGETRRCGVIRDSFIVTRFLDGTRDGRDFMPGGKRRDDVALRRRFCELVAPQLAKLHRHGFFHKALHVRNVLYRGETPETMELFFIDVARCRIRFGSLMKGAMLFDLYTPLRDLELPAAEGQAFLAGYLRAFPEPPFSPEQLEAKLRAFRRHGKRFNVIDF